MAEHRHPTPGWYPDPTASGRLRLWDGVTWTGETRDSPAAPRAADPASPPATAPVLEDRVSTGSGVPRATPVRGPSGPGPGRSGAAGAILAVLTAAFLVAGLYEVRHGSSGGKADPNAFAAGSAAATTAPASALPDVRPGSPAGSPPGCDGGGAPSAVAIARWFARSGLPVSVITSNTVDSGAAGSGAIPVGAPSGRACTAASFRDTRAAGLNSVTVFPKAGDATMAASTNGGVTIHQGPVVVILDRPLAPYQGSYGSQLHALLGDA